LSSSAGGGCAREARAFTGLEGVVLDDRPSASPTVRSTDLGQLGRKEALSNCSIDRDSVRFAFREAVAAGMALSVPRSPVRATSPRLARFEIFPHENAGKRILVRFRRPGNHVRR
jgi:hypothetical protein